MGAEPAPTEPTDPPSENEAGAQILFKAGRAAMMRRDYDLACHKFTESHRVDPAPGTLLNLGNCEEKRGNLASSWQRYTEAMNMLDEEDQRHAFAREKAESLEPRVPRLTVTLDKNTPRQTHVSRNGQAIDRELGAPVRLDPGRFVVVAEAVGYQKRVYDVELSPGEHKQLRVGVRDRLRVEGPAPAAPIVTGDSEARPVLGYVLGGTGIVLAAAGATFGVLTYQQYQTVSKHCDVDAQLCFDSTGQDAAETGADYEVLAYVLGGAGLVSLSAGLFVLLSDGSDGGPTVTLSLSPGAIGLEALDRGHPGRAVRGLRVTGTF